MPKGLTPLEIETVCKWADGSPDPRMMKQVVEVRVGDIVAFAQHAVRVNKIEADLSGSEEIILSGLDIYDDYPYRMAVIANRHAIGVFWDDTEICPQPGEAPYAVPPHLQSFEDDPDIRIWKLPSDILSYEDIRNAGFMSIYPRGTKKSYVNSKRMDIPNDALGMRIKDWAQEFSLSMRIQMGDSDDLILEVVASQ